MRLALQMVSKPFHLCYLDGDEEWIDLKTEVWRIAAEVISPYRMGFRGLDTCFHRGRLHEHCLRLDLFRQQAGAAHYIP